MLRLSFLLTFITTVRSVCDANCDPNPSSCPDTTTCNTCVSGFYVVTADTSCGACTSNCKSCGPDPGTICT